MTSRVGSLRARRLPPAPMDRRGWLRLGLDLALVALLAAVVAQLLLPALAFRLVFAVQVGAGFVSDMRGTVIRSVAILAVVSGYAAIDEISEDILPMELEEWPMLGALAGLAALLADRWRAAEHRLGTLAQLARRPAQPRSGADRRAIALDLHDGVGQSLSALMLTLDRATLATNEKETAAMLASARVMAADALEEVRGIATGSGPPAVESLVQAVGRLAALAGLPVELDVDQAVERVALEPRAGTAAFRIVQAALSNVARHSRAGGARVTVARGEGEIRVEVRDDGVGFDPLGPHGGLGLAGMAERAEAVGGRVLVESRPGFGTVVSLAIPTPHAAADDRPPAIPGARW